MKNLKQFQYNASQFSGQAKEGFRIWRKGILGFLESFFRQFLKSISFSLKTFMRTGMGSMTFSWATIFFAAIWVQYCLSGTYSLNEFIPPDEVIWNWFTKENGWYYLALPFWYIAMIFAQFWGVVANFFPGSLGNFGLSNDWGANIPYLISLLVIISGIYKKYTIWLKHRRKIIFDPLSGGESLLFEPLLKSVAPRKQDKLRFYYEIGFLIALGFLATLLSLNDPIFLNYSGFFLIGALSMLIEEAIAEQQRLREIEYRFANEFKAKNLQSAYQAYQQEQRSLFATVSFAAGQLQPVYPNTFYSPSQEYTLWDDIQQSYRRFILKAPLAMRWVLPAVGLVIITVYLALWLNKEPAIGQAKVSQTTMKLRDQPSLYALTDGTTVPQGATVEVLEQGYFDNENREWWRIRYKGHVGYCSYRSTSGVTYLQMIDDPDQGIEILDEFPYVAEVITENFGYLNLRFIPSQNGAVVDSIPHGSLVTVLSCGLGTQTLESTGKSIQGKWCKVQFEENTGYCFSYYIRPTDF